MPPHNSYPNGYRFEGTRPPYLRQRFERTKDPGSVADVVHVQKLLKLRHLVQIFEVKVVQLPQQPNLLQEVANVTPVRVLSGEDLGIADGSGAGNPIIVAQRNGRKGNVLDWVEGVVQRCDQRAGREADPGRVQNGSQDGRLDDENEEPHQSVGYYGTGIEVGL